MSENPIAFSNLNDFIFCPVSIYFHSLQQEEDNLLLQDGFQLDGTEAHKKSDAATYSSRKDMLQGISVYSYKYNILGKIDTFDIKKGLLTERKRKIKVVYDGYIFQLYAQYFALVEMGYVVNELRLYSMSDNKIYLVKKPEDDNIMYKKFCDLIEDFNEFSFIGFKQGNAEKCKNCIYETLCSFSALKGK